MRFYTTERLGPTQSLNPAGFLIIENTPVARTGIQDYHVSEIRGDDGQPLLAGADNKIMVSRSPDEVFKDESLASYNAAPLCMDHPLDNVTPANWRDLACGDVLNPRRGEGMLDDLVMCDLVVKCPNTIAAIRSRDIREISVGYDARYVQVEPGKATQHDIIVNHVAFVPAGRCGLRCAIGDHQAQEPPVVVEKERNKGMAKRSFLDRWITRAADAESEEEKEKLKEEMKDRIADESEEKKEEEKKEYSEDRRWKDQGAANDRFDARFSAIDKTLAGISDQLKGMADAAASEQEVEMEDKATGDKSRFVMRRGDKMAKDQGGEMPTPEENPEMMGETDLPGTSPGDRKRIGDSVPMELLWQETIAAAEILVPGISMPTFDAKHHWTLTAKRLCALRRRALDSACQSDEGKAIVAQVVGKDLATLKVLSCDSVKMAFQAAAQLKRQENNAQTAAAARSGNGGAGTRDATKGVPTLADIQKMQDEHYAKLAGRA